MTGAEFNELLLNRRSIRRYTDQQISAEDVKTILEAGLLAPTSKNSHSTRFIAIDEKDTLKRMSECRTMGSGPVAGAALAVLVLGDMSVSDAWVEDCSIAAAFMQLQVAALGLGSVWIQIRGRVGQDDIPSDDILRDLLGYPENVTAECIISIGYKNETRKPLDPEKTLWENVHIERWSSREN